MERTDAAEITFLHTVNFASREISHAREIRGVAGVAGVDNDLVVSKN